MQKDSEVFNPHFEVFVDLHWQHPDSTPDHTFESQVSFVFKVTVDELLFADQIRQHLHSMIFKEYFLKFPICEIQIFENFQPEFSKKYGVFCDGGNHFEIIEHTK